MKITGQVQIPSTQFGLPPFALARPANLDEVCAAIEKGGRPPVFLAGGTDLFLQFRSGIRPEMVIDLNTVAELRTISLENETLHIGAGARHAAGLTHPDISARLSRLAEAWELLGNVRVRGMATLGGNLMARNNRYEGPLFAAALNAQLCFQGPGGAAHISAEEYWTAETPANMVLSRIEVPLTGNPRFVYDRSLRPIMTMALGLSDAPVGGLSARVAIGSQWNAPQFLSFGIDRLSDAQANAQDLANVCLDELPDDLEDGDYIRSAGAAILARLIQRIGEDT